MAVPISRKTFDSIVSPVNYIESVRGVLSDIKLCLPNIINRYIPWLSNIPLFQGMPWYPTWKSLPTFRVCN